MGDLQGAYEGEAVEQPPSLPSPPCVSEVRIGRRGLYISTAPARAHPELPQCSCSPIGTFALPAPRQKSRFGDAFSACKEQISVATVTSSRNLSYHYTPRLGFKARTPALKQGSSLSLCGSHTRRHEASLARLTCARNHVKQNSTFFPISNKIIQKKQTF